MNSPRPSIRVFATDVEDTLVGDAGPPDRFKAWWESLAEPRPLLVYNTRRGIAEAGELTRTGRIPTPQFMIGGMGTEVHDPSDASVSASFHDSVAPTWEPDAVQRIVDAIPGIRFQPAESSPTLKLSWIWRCASAADVVQLRVRLQTAGLHVSLAYTNYAYLDVVPGAAGKGNALAWLCRRIGVALENVLVTGASANNASMFSLPDVNGIVLANASRDVFAAARSCRPVVTIESGVEGVLAGLKQFGLRARAAEVPQPQYWAVEAK